MSLKPPSVGSDIEAKCGKCKQVTWHVILAMVGREIARVQCKACDAQHKYRSPKAAAPARRPRSTSGTASSRSRSRAKPEPEPVGPAVEADTSRPIRRYKASERFEVRERVDHVKFGLGVVEESIPGKVTIYFTSEGRKMLAQAREETKLTRPPPLRHDD